VLEWITSRWGTITSTVIVVGRIFTYFHTNIISIKNERINILETQNKYLSEYGPFPQTVQKINESIKSIHEKLIPYLY